MSERQSDVLRYDCRNRLTGFMRKDFGSVLSGVTKRSQLRLTEWSRNDETPVATDESVITGALRCNYAKLLVGQAAAHFTAGGTTRLSNTMWRGRLRTRAT